MFQYETGTTGIKNFGYATFSTSQPILIPNEQQLSAFVGFLSLKFKRTATTALTIRTLTNLRDTLLPKLISGKLRVPEAEEMVAELGL
jgi:type I restriction enzyme S subunit